MTFRTFWSEKDSYQRKTLLLVVAISAICAISSVVVFSVGDFYHRKDDTARDASAAAALLSDIMRLPFYAGDIERMQEMASQTITAFGVNKVVVSDNAGRVVLDFPADRPRAGAIGTSSIALNTELDPLASITGEASNSQGKIGTVTVYSTGDRRTAESLVTLVAMSIAGILLWISTSYIGYKLARKTTIMFDKLINGIASVERGEARLIETSELDDEGVKRIADKINDMGNSLYAREEENVQLHKQIAEQMEGRAQRAESLMQAKLFQANKMSTLGLLVSSIAHEINNPNSTIQLQAETCERLFRSGTPILERIAREEGGFSLAGLPFDEAKVVLQESLEGIIDQSRRINGVVKGLREYVIGDNKGNSKRDVPVTDIINRCLSLLQSQIKRGNCIVTQHSTENLAIYCNQFQIESVIVNLLQNAFRAVKDIEVDCHVDITARDNGSEVLIVVSDNGAGIPEEDLPHLCDPFFSRHLDSGGTGLGLFISKGILDDHSATIEFKSQIGEGTQVALRFPYEDRG